MNTDFLIMQAQFKALRNYFLESLPAILHEKEDSPTVWYAKFLIWENERESLNYILMTEKLSFPEKERIDRRLFQLQVLMDVAYTLMQTEEPDKANARDSYVGSQALHILEQSDGSEEDMCRLIDEL